MIKFGMSLPAIFNQLRKGYIKVRGTEPKGLDLIKIKQEAMQKFEDMRKVLDMQGNPIDPSKPIMGGTQMGQRGIFDNIFNRMQSQMGKKPNVVKSDAEIKAALEKSNKDSLKNLKDKIDDPDKKADGGRIGLKEGEGIMQMASVDEPFYRDSESDRDDFSFRMFNKPYKELNTEELEEFREEMMRLMNKFSAREKEDMKMASYGYDDAMGESFEEFLRLKKLKEIPEDMEFDEYLDQLDIDIPYSKKDRGAQSIKLAEGGRIGLKDGMLAKMRSGVKPDGGIFKSLFANRNAPILSGLNTAELFDLVTTLSNLPGLAEGGRIGYKDGPKDPGKRKFIKAAVGIASMIPGMSMIGKGAKVAAPVVAKAAEISGPALAKIVETVMDLGKLISVKGRRVKEMVTKKKHQGVEVTEDIADQSYIIKKDNKEIYYKPGRMDETGGVEDDIIEILEDRIKKAGGGLSYMLGE